MNLILFLNKLNSGNIIWVILYLKKKICVCKVFLIIENSIVLFMLLLILNYGYIREKYKSKKLEEENR